MQFGWFRRLTLWGLSALGVLLALLGLGAMADGWDKIQIERGWSLFIAGSVAASGGVVTLALCAILARLDHAIFARDTERRATPAIDEPQVAEQKNFEPAAKTPAKARGEAASKEAGLTEPKAAPVPPAPPRPELAAPAPSKSEIAAPTPQARAGESFEVDSYVNGDTTYVMFADGSVEVRNTYGAQRFASLSELKAKVGEQV